MKRGDIWWVCFDPAIGTEIKKTRPAIIISRNLSNRSMGRVTVVPITSNVVRLYPGETFVSVRGVQYKAVATQISTVDHSRLQSRLDRLSADDLLAVEQAIKVHLAL